MLILKQDHLNIYEDELVLFKAFFHWGYNRTEDINNVRDVLGPDVVKLFRFLTLTLQQFAEYFSDFFFTQKERNAIHANLCGENYYVVPKLLSQSRTVRKIDSLIKDKINKYALYYVCSAESINNTETTTCYYNFRCSQAFWLLGVEFHTMRPTGRKRRSNFSPSPQDYYTENITFSVSKITTAKNSNLTTSQMLLLTDYKEKCSYQTTANIMFDSPVFISPGCLHEIKAVLRCKGTYSLRCPNSNIKSCLISGAALKTEHRENAGIFRNLLFYANSDKFLTYEDCSEDE
jgi:hypothetical protein